MKKFKCAIALLAALAIAVPFAGCNKNKGNDGNNGGGNDDGNGQITQQDVIRPYSLSLDTSKVKLIYDMDEDFTAENLGVTVVKNNVTQGVMTDPEAVQLDDSKLTINSSAFRKGVAGDYTIILNYTENNRTVSAFYSVTVQKSAGVFIEKTTTNYDFVLAGTEIDLSDITVKMATAVAGPKGEALTSDKYTVKCFDSAQNEVALTGDKLVVTKSGTYQIWAFVENYTIPGTTETEDVKAFVLVNAVDEIESITFDDTAEGTVITQPKSVIDHISPTWKFTATYKSGYTEQVGKGAGLEIQIVTNKELTNNAIVSYTSTNCIGETKKVTTKVRYTITASEGVVEEHKLSITELTDKIGDDAKIAETDHSYFTATDFEAMTNNAFFTVINKDANFQGIDYRGKSNNRLEIRGEVFEIDFEGVGTIEVSAASTSAANVSAFYLVDEEGNYMAADFVVSEYSYKDDFENIYAVKAKNAIKFTYVILNSGKYRLCTADSLSVNGATMDTKRPVNLLGLTVTMEKGE